MQLFLYFGYRQKNSIMENDRGYPFLAYGENDKKYDILLHKELAGFGVTPDQDERIYSSDIIDLYDIREPGELIHKLQEYDKLQEYIKNAEMNLGNYKKILNQRVEEIINRSKRDIKSNVNDNTIKYYIVLFINNNGKETNIIHYDANDRNKNIYVIAYEQNGELREINTNLLLVPDNASYIPDDALIYHSISLATDEVAYYNYFSEHDENVALEYAKTLCELGKNPDLYEKYKKEHMNRCLQKHLKDIRNWKI